MPCNEADAVRLVRLNDKKMAIKIENNNKKNVQIMVPDKNLYIDKNKLVMKASPFFYE
jgi:hypothetical protein